VVVIVNIHMPTNMPQPWEQGFDRILAHWWLRLNQRHPMNLPIHQGTHSPIRDWAGQADPDAVWFYGLDDREDEAWQEPLALARHLASIDSVHVTTALAITAQLDEDLLHELEIPGIWLARVQKA